MKNLKSLLKINEIVEKGYSPKEIVKVLIAQFRNLIIAKDENTISLKFVFTIF